MIFKIRWWFYHYIYVPIVSLWNDYQQRNDPLLRLCRVKYAGTRDIKPSIVRTREKWGFRRYLSTSVRDYILTICLLQLVDISLSPSI